MVCCREERVLRVVGYGMPHVECDAFSTSVCPAYHGCNAAIIPARDLMLEVNPLYNALKDMQARTDVLRGYL